MERGFANVEGFPSVQAWGRASLAGFTVTDHPIYGAGKAAVAGRAEALAALADLVVISPEILEEVVSVQPWTEVVKERFLKTHRCVQSLGSENARLVSVDLRREMSDEDLSFVEFKAKGERKVHLCYGDPADINHPVDCPGLHEGDFLPVGEPGPCTPERIVTLPERGKVDRRGRVKATRFSLAQLLSDGDLVRKLKLSDAELSAIRRVAATNPVKATELAVSKLEELHPGEGMRVYVGKYANSRVQAKATVNEMARIGVMRTSYSAVVEFNRVRMILPDTGGEYVEGPMSEVQFVHDLAEIALLSGSVHTNFLFAYEMTLMDCCICDADGQVMPGVVESHASREGLVPTEERVFEPSDTDLALDLAMLCEKVLPVTPVDEPERIHASAVYVAPGCYLVNEHVIQTCGGFQIAGQTAALVRSVAMDLWLVKSAGSGEGWVLREPIDGEAAVMVTSVGDTVEYSEPAAVGWRSGLLVRTPRFEVARPGTSGSALVALADGALLGVYSGVMNDGCLFSRFTTEMYTELIDFVECVTSERGKASPADGLLSDLRDRGFGVAADRALSSLVPLYEVGGCHLGMAAAHGGRLHTTVDTTVTRVVGPDGEPLPGWQDDSRGGFRSDTDRMGSPFLRPPVRAEMVVIAGKDSDGAYFSEEVPVVNVAGGGSRFFLKAFEKAGLPLQGGLVLSVRDAAVLGSYYGCRVDRKAGFVGCCYRLFDQPEPQAVEEPVEALQRLFPHLGVPGWPEGILPALLQHSTLDVNDTMSYYARVGDSVARVFLYDYLRAAGVPLATWGYEVDERQGSSKLCQVAAEAGLDVLVQAGPGVAFKPNSKIYADVVRALVGAASKASGEGAARRLCEGFGMVPKVLRQ